jgi:Glutathionylspermidine synthase preATP-grasp
MTVPIQAGAHLPMHEWNRLRLRAIFDYCKWDPQCGDHSVLARFPLLLESATVIELGQMAERLTSEALDAEDEILANPKLLRQLSIPKPIREYLEKAKEAPQANHVRVMRFDFHFTTRGWQISEVNADVPGGYVEASGWNSLFEEVLNEYDAPINPTATYADAICEIVPVGGLIALAHATVYSEDRQVMAHLGRELEGRGRKTCLISPRNLNWNCGRAVLKTGFAIGQPALVARLSPAEWLPSMCEKSCWAPWFGESVTPLSNPGSALALQSKRFPLIWSELKTDLTTWRKLLPRTSCPSEIQNLDRDDLLLKPAFGRVGEDVAIRGVTESRQHQEILRAVRREEELWVAQERFEVAPIPTADGDVFPCVGVYTVNGKMAGLYGRAARNRLIDQNAEDIAVLIRRPTIGRIQ